MSIARTTDTVAAVDPDRDRRRRNVDSAAHSSEMEGLTSSDEFRADAEIFVAGAIDVDELVRRTRARYGSA